MQNTTVQSESAVSSNVKRNTGNNLQTLNSDFPDRLLSREEVELSFGISKRYLEIAAVKNSGPPIIRIGRSVRYRRCDIIEWIKTQRTTFAN